MITVASEIISNRTCSPILDGGTIWNDNSLITRFIQSRGYSHDAIIHVFLAIVIVRESFMFRILLIGPCLVINKFCVGVNMCKYISPKISQRLHNDIVFSRKGRGLLQTHRSEETRLNSSHVKNSY